MTEVDRLAKFKKEQNKYEPLGLFQIVSADKPTSHICANNKADSNITDIHTVRTARATDADSMAETVDSPCLFQTAVAKTDGMRAWFNLTSIVCPDF